MLFSKYTPKALREFDQNNQSKCFKKKKKMEFVTIGPKATLPSLRRRRNLAPASNNITIKYITSPGVSVSSVAQANPAIYTAKKKKVCVGC